MEQEPRGVLLPFRRAARPTMTGRTGSPSQEAQDATAANVSVDHEVNTEWDLLIRLATQAWSWRDPESLDVLEHTVNRLRTWIGSDWSV
jgi:hypothetical protein